MVDCVDVPLVGDFAAKKYFNFDAAYSPFV